MFWFIGKVFLQINEISSGFQINEIWSLQQQSKYSNGKKHPQKKPPNPSRHCEGRGNRDVLTYSPPNSCRSQYGIQLHSLEHLNSTLSQTETWIRPSMCWRHKKLEEETTAVSQISLHFLLVGIWRDGEILHIGLLWNILRKSLNDTRFTTVNSLLDCLY